MTIKEFARETIAMRSAFRTNKAILNLEYGLQNPSVDWNKHHREEIGRLIKFLEEAAELQVKIESTVDPINIIHWWGLINEKYEKL